MSITLRHKKPGAFRKLVLSLETTPADRRKKILESFRAEDAMFADHAEQSLFEFKDFATTNELVLCEVVDAMKNEMRTLALALKNGPADLVGKFTRVMRPQQAYDFKEYTEGMASVLSREQVAAQFRVISKARDMEEAGKFTLKNYVGPYPKK